MFLFGEKIKPFWLPFLAVTAVILLFYGRALLPGRVLMPTDIITEGWPPWQEPNVPVEVHNFMLTDVVNYIYPVKIFMAEAITSGNFPLWNPYIFLGYPFTYNTQAGPFYPLSLFYYLLPGATAVDATIFGQILLGMALMFLYLRSLGLNPAGLAAGTIIFLFNGLMVVWLEWQVVHAAVIWLPGQLYLVERLHHKLLAQQSGRTAASTRPEMVALAFLFVFPWLGGHWNWTLYSSITLALYGLVRLNTPPLRPSLTTFQVWFWPLAAGTALSLVQVLPAFRYLSQTHRLPLPFWDLLNYSLGSRAAAWVIPNFYGSSLQSNFWGSAISNDVETAVYCSLLALLLVGLAWWLRPGWPTPFFTIWGLVTLSWTLGTPTYFVLYILPVFNGLHPSRAAFVVTFCVAILTAIVVDRLSELETLPGRLPWGVAVAGLGILALAGGFTFTFWADVQRTWVYLQPELATFALFFLLSGGLIALRLAGKLPGRVFGWLAVACIAADLWAFGHNYNTIGYTEQIYPPTETAVYLQQALAQEPGRIMTLAEGIAFSPNTALAERIPNISGYEPGILLRMVNFIRTAEGAEPIHFGRVLMPLRGADSPLLKMANVKYIVTTQEQWAAEAVAVNSPPAVENWLPLPVQHPLLLPDAGLQRLDLLLQVVNGSGQVRVRVLSSKGDYEFANAVVETAAFSAATPWVSFYFSPFPSEWGREFLFVAEFVGEGEVQVGSTAGQPAFVSYYLPRPQLAHEARKTRVYLNEGYFPRAFGVTQVQLASSEEEALQFLLDHQNELDHQAVLELEGQPAPRQLSYPAGSPPQVTITRYDYNQISMQVTAPAGGFVVLSDTYYPGWVAELNGVDIPIYRANSIMRGVEVPAGEHRLVFTFRPLDFYVGLGVALLTAGVCLLFLVGVRPGKRAV